MNENPPPPEELKGHLRNYLQFLQRAGFLYLVPSPNTPRYSAHSRAAGLEALRRETAGCKLCGLCEGRTHVVFGEGNENADVLFVGEAPGAEEDKQGRPFVGRSGQLLTKMLETCGLTRDEVFIANVIKCRPPENRDPQSEEIETCEPYLLAQIDLIQPKVIVTLGKFAACSLLRVKTGIMKMRGQWQGYHGVKLMPTLHPAAVLRNMNHHDDVLSDIRRAIEAARKIP